jgi:1,4-alpha-glucan branching enzyme
VHSVIAFVRHGEPGTSPMLVVCNFTPVPRRGWRVGVPRGGRWVERLNTDSSFYGGSNLGTPQAHSQPVACDGRAESVVIDLPPLGTAMFEWLP